MEDLIYSVLALGFTFLIGLYRNKPGYTKGKSVINALDKALEDDKLTTEELKRIKALVAGR